MKGRPQNYAYQIRKARAVCVCACACLCVRACVCVCVWTTTCPETSFHVASCAERRTEGKRGREREIDTHAHTHTHARTYTHTHTHTDTASYHFHKVQETKEQVSVISGLSEYILLFLLQSKVKIYMFILFHVLKYMFIVSVLILVANDK